MSIKVKIRPNKASQLLQEGPFSRKKKKADQAAAAEKAPEGEGDALVQKVIKKGKEVKDTKEKMDKSAWGSLAKAVGWIPGIGDGAQLVTAIKYLADGIEGEGDRSANFALAIANGIKAVPTAPVATATAGKINPEAIGKFIEEVAQGAVDQYKGVAKWVEALDAADDEGGLFDKVLDKFEDFGKSYRAALAVVTDADKAEQALKDLEQEDPEAYKVMRNTTGWRKFVPDFLLKEFAEEGSDAGQKLKLLLEIDDSQLKLLLEAPSNMASQIARDDEEDEEETIEKSMAAYGEEEAAPTGREEWEDIAQGTAAEHPLRATGMAATDAAAAAEKGKEIAGNVGTAAKAAKKVGQLMSAAYGLTPMGQRAKALAAAGIPEEPKASRFFVKLVKTMHGEMPSFSKAFEKSDVISKGIRKWLEGFISQTATILQIKRNTPEEKAEAKEFFTKNPEAAKMCKIQGGCKKIKIPEKKSPAAVKESRTLNQVFDKRNEMLYERLMKAYAS